MNFAPIATEPNIQSGSNYYKSCSLVEEGKCTCMLSSVLPTKNDHLRAAYYEPVNTDECKKEHEFTGKYKKTSRDTVPLLVPDVCSWS